MTILGYARVSTNGQTLASQEAPRARPRRGDRLYLNQPIIEPLSMQFFALKPL
jgi:hypothetical protein